MRQAYWLAVYLFVFSLFFATTIVKAEMDDRPSRNAFFWRWDFDNPFDFHTGVLMSRRGMESTSVYSDETALSLYEAVTNRLGLPYRARGTDDRGYDCSGFVWRVFHDAGIEFERGPARKLWETLPQASAEERLEFGTLVFFKGLNHVGIVRDARSFYHASSSQGVVRSYFSEYWGNRVIGYRRAFAGYRWAFAGYQQTFASFDNPVHGKGKRKR